MAADITTAPELTTEQVAALLVRPLEAASVVANQATREGCLAAFANIVAGTRAAME